MPYLLDTNWISRYLSEEPEAIEFIERLVPQGVAISIITYMEAYQGTLQKPDPAQSQAKLEALLTNVPLFPVTLAVARRCAQLREDLKAHNRRVRSRALDLLIAATAVEQGLILATRNVDDFKDIPGLELYRETTPDAPADEPS